MYDDWFAVKSDNCYVIVFIKNKQLGGKVSNTDTSKKFMNELKENCGTDFDCMKKVCQEACER